ncbi:hypothetical protein BV22DRAFT_688591 [Leucogyrophana mollusca]|uniref:Uncharacterized protein n=1 Tax=Leucogyrophana mollusca TaxID=85980 RepID=A0ACB8BAQ0_9AGAM|nr:hypothetical protein BV22DRAFT_688591 [Leucogyrophana mollusca]
MQAVSAPSLVLIHLSNLPLPPSSTLKKKDRPSVFLGTLVLPLPPSADPWLVVSFFCLLSKVLVCASIYHHTIFQLLTLHTKRVRILHPPILPLILWT